MACFLPSGRNFNESRRGRGTKFLNDREIVPVDKAGKWALAQRRAIILVEGRNLSRCSSLLEGSCASPGAGLANGPVKRLKFCKKHDKQLTFIVRVSC